MVRASAPLEVLGKRNRPSDQAAGSERFPPGDVLRQQPSNLCPRLGLVNPVARANMLECALPSLPHFLARLAVGFTGSRIDSGRNGRTTWAAPDGRSFPGSRSSAGIGCTRADRLRAR